MSVCKILKNPDKSPDSTTLLRGGGSDRSGSGVMIAVDARQRTDDGVVFYRPSKNVAMSDGTDGVIGPRYFCFALRLHLGPQRRRIILREQPNHV